MKPQITQCGVVADVRKNKLQRSCGMKPQITDFPP